MVMVMCALLRGQGQGGICALPAVALDLAGSSGIHWQDWRSVLVPLLFLGLITALPFLDIWKAQ